MIFLDEHSYLVVNGGAIKAHHKELAQLPAHTETESDEVGSR